MAHPANLPVDAVGVAPTATKPFPSRPRQEQSGHESSDQIFEYSAVPKPDKGHEKDGTLGDGDDSAFRLRRFPLRSIFLVAVPPFVAAYFVITQVVLFSPDPDVVPYGHRNASWVFYSWFLVGVFGVGAAQYGLEGIEAALLQEPFWAPNNAKILAMHSEKSWGGFGGWMHAGKTLWRRRMQERKVVGRLWLLLATLSLLVTVGLALSGLAMELYDGYVKALGHPVVVGQTWDRFNIRKYGSELEDLATAWTGGGTMNLPGAGILYTSPGTDRSANESLSSLPNSLPKEGGHVDIFIAPQAAVLVEGNAWGLRLGYRCDLVTSMSQFTVLNQRASKLSYYSGYNFTTPDGKTVDLYETYDNSTFLTPDERTIKFWNGGDRDWVDNVWTYGETGATPPPVTSPYDSARHSKYYWRDASTFDEEGLREHGAVYEVALWQLRFREQFPANYTFDETVEPSITDIGGPFLLDEENGFSLNSSFFPKHPGSDKFNMSAAADPSRVLHWPISRIISAAPPMGLRCMYQYAPGYADLHPDTATFTSFTPSLPRVAGAGNIPPWAVNAVKIMDRKYYDLFTAGSAAPPRIAVGSSSQTGFLQPRNLMHAVLRGFAVDLLYLMYDNIAHLEGGYEHPNLTTTKEGKIIGPGPVPPLLPAILLCIWAAGCVVLGVVYGFKPRWADTLNGFTMLCLGADFAEEIRSGGFGVHRDFADADGLSRIPGMIGDAGGNEQVGHVSLVDRRKGGVVRGGKLYR